MCHTGQSNQYYNKASNDFLNQYMDSKSASLCTDEHWIYLFIYISFIVNIDKWERKRIQLDMQEDF